MLSYDISTRISYQEWGALTLCLRINLGSGNVVYKELLKAQ